MKRKKIVLKRDPITKEFKCPSFSKCCYASVKPSRIKNHVSKCRYNSSTLKHSCIEIEKLTFSSYKIPTKKRKIDEITKYVKTDEDVDDFLNVFSSRLKNDLGKTVPEYLQLSHEKKVASLRLQLQNSEIERQQLEAKNEDLQNRLTDFKNDTSPPFDKKRISQIKSSISACKSKDDFSYHMSVVLQRFPKVKIIFLGDQHVYEAQRRKEPAFPGKFHFKLNMLLAIFSALYDHGINDVLKNENYFNKKKSLKSIPSGYFKMSEKLFVNSFLQYWELYTKILKNHISGYRFLKHDRDSFNFVFEKHIPNNMVKYHQNSSFVNNLSYLCTRLVFSYFLLMKSLKSNDFELYILSIKLFLSWALALDKGNYFRIFVLHLFDIFYSWSDDMVKLFKANLCYVTCSKNLIPFDEMGEIVNADTKKTTKNAKNPSKKVEVLSQLNPIIAFLKHLFESKYEYSKKKVLPAVIEDLKRGTNVLENHFLNNLLVCIGGFKTSKISGNKNVHQAQIILEDEWNKHN